MNCDPGDEARSIRFTPIAVGSYADPWLTPLDGGERTVDTEVRAVAAAFAEFGGAVVDWDVAMADRRLDAIDDRLAAWTRSDHPHAVLYWVGHARPGHDTQLLHAGSDDHHGSITVSRVAEAIRPRDRLGDGHWDIVIIDTCDSKRFVQLLGAQIDDRAGTASRPVLLIGTSGAGQTTLGRFTDALESVLHHTFGAEPVISFSDLADELRRALVGAEVVPKDVTHAVLRRVGVLTGVPRDVADRVREVVSGLRPDQRRHFAARDGELGEHTGFFTGRVRETAEVVRWLADHESGVLAVTGAAGSGKSALLSHLIVHSLPDLRDVLADHRMVEALPASRRPPDDVFTLVVHLSGLSTRDIAARVAAGLGLSADPSHTAVDRTLDHLTRNGASRRTLLFDALDEAVDPLAVAAVLHRFGRVPGVRVVVATRGDIDEGPDHPVPDRQNLLDALRVGAADTVTIARDADTIVQYFMKRFHAAIENDQLPHADDAVIAAAAHEIARGGHEFLFSCLMIQEFFANRRFLDLEKVRALVASSHRDLFAYAVRRFGAQRPVNAHLLRLLAHSQGRGMPMEGGAFARVASTLANTPVDNHEIHDLLDAAGPYLIMDRERGQTVHRLAHRTYVEHFTADPADGAEVHRAVLDTAVAVPPGQALPSYLVHHVSAHAAHLGEPGWQCLGDYPDLLDRLDPTSVAENAVRTALGRHPLPPAVVGVLGAHHLLTDAAPTDRPGLRQLAMARHTTVTIHPAAALPGAWHVRWASLAPTSLYQVLADHGTVLTTPPDSADWQDTARARRSTGAHTCGVTAVAAVPVAGTGALLATGDRDGVVRLWESTAGALVGEPLRRHAGAVRLIVPLPAPDGRTLLATGDDEAWVWDPRTGDPIGDPLPGGSLIARAPDGRTLLATGGEVCLWDPTTRTRATLPHRFGVVTALTTVPAGDRHLVVVADRREVSAWDPTTGARVGAPLVGPAASVVAVGSRVAILDHYGEVYLWDPTAHSPDPVRLALPARTGSDGMTTGVAVLHTPSGPVLVTGDDTGAVVLWDPTTDRLVTRLHLGGPVTALADLGAAAVAVGMADGVAVVVPARGR